MIRIQFDSFLSLEGLDHGLDHGLVHLDHGLDHGLS
jgi:hypothetical protein